MQEDRIAEAWRAIAGLRRDQWADASQEQRLSALQRAENEAARIQGRDPLSVALDAGAPSEEKGYYNDEQILIGEHSLNNDDVSEIANTLAHEGRHAYQDYAIEHPNFHPDADDVQSWRENMQPRAYIPPEQGYQQYRNQPIERDAWSFGNNITNGVYGAKENNE